MGRRRVRTLVRRLGRSIDLDVKIPQVVGVGNSADARDPVDREKYMVSFMIFLRARMWLPRQTTSLRPIAPERGTYGSAISRSVSLMILFGRDMMRVCEVVCSGRK